MKMHIRLDRIFTNFEMQRKKSWCRLFLMSLEQSTTTPRTKDQKHNLYRLQAYKLHDPDTLSHPFLAPSFCHRPFATATATAPLLHLINLFLLHVFRTDIMADDRADPIMDNYDPDGEDRKSTRLNSSHWLQSRMPSSA